MTFKQEFTITVDIKKSTAIASSIPTYVHNDTNILYIKILDNGVPYEYSTADEYVVTFKRPDGQGVLGYGVYENGMVKYELGVTETAIKGNVECAVQLHLTDTRITTRPFMIRVLEDLEDALTSTEGYGVLQTLIIEVDTIKTEWEAEKINASTYAALAQEKAELADTKATYAQTQGDYANEKALLADQKATLADQKATLAQTEASNLAQMKLDVQTATTDAITAKTNADLATTNANDKANFAQTQGEFAETQGNYALEQGDYSKAQGDYAKAQADSIITNAYLADEAVQDANVAVGLADQAVIDAQTARDNANSVIAEAQQSVIDANTARDSANTAATNANTQATHALNQGNYAKSIGDQNKTRWLTPVANFAAIATTYPSPTHGDTVQTLDDSKIFRYDQTAWIFTQMYNSTALTDIQNKLADTNRQSQNLLHGTQIINATQNSLVDFEIQGRTLISLGNSNLEANKNYVLSGKNYKIRAEGREGTLINGVAKFTKNASLITKADFGAKVSGSVTENPHRGFRTGSQTSLQTPTGTWAELSQAYYDNVKTLDGVLGTQATSSLNGGIAQMLYSFNTIEAIERKMGRIPSDTVSGKRQWIVDNVQRLTANWHGWGSSVGGNGASFSVYRYDTNAWSGAFTHTSGIVAKLAFTCTSGGSAWQNIVNNVDVNGMVHFLAYTTNPSDGVTASQLNTDFIECEVELKSTAVLDTRPIVTRVATFEGKVSGDLTSNPHVFKGYRSGASLITPTGGAEFDTTNYGHIQTLNGTVNSYGINTNTYIAQHMFSFDLISEIERNVGRIPKATVAEKVQWLKDNVQSLVCEWSGFGSSVGGNKATLAVNMANQGGGWNNSAERPTHTNGTVTKLSFALNGAWYNVANTLDSSGMIHFLAYADASDGVTASTINTDMISLDITLKQGATLFDPILPLYEVDASEMSNILVAWDEATVISRYPRVQSVQHLQNLAVIAEGENLLPSFSEWTLHANAVVKSPYELELNATAISQDSWVSLPIVNGQNYTIKTSSNGICKIYKDKISSHIPANQINSGADFGTSSVTFIADSTFNGFVSVRVTSSGSGKFTFTNPMLTLGNVAKPFVPRNPSYLFAPVKLGAIGDKKDILTQIDGQWNVRKLVEKDVVLDGSLAWNYNGDLVGVKEFFYALNGQVSDSAKLLKYNGSSVKLGGSGLPEYFNTTGGTAVRIGVPDSESGFGETYNPLTTEIQAYFNGWQAKTVDANGKPTAWRSLGDGTDAPTQTLAYVSTNKAPNTQPYKISFSLATPQTINVTNLVEGSIAISSQTQVTVDSAVINREKVTPVLNVNNYHINNTTYSGSLLKNKVKSVLNIYKNGIIDTQNWTKVSDTTAYGLVRYTLPQSAFDNQALYEVSYYVNEKEKMSNNATEVRAYWSGSLKDVVDTNVEKLTDLASQTSINTRLLVDILARLKAGGL